ncbi:MAG: hypothetical protein P1S60_06460, partial [Anaerolineae bacterium]|nr:hypothetical protein [Anaerolineae bacterium]
CGGIILERAYVRYKVADKLWQRIGCFVLGMAGVMVLRVGMKYVLSSFHPESLFRFIRYSAIGFWFTFGAPWLFARLGLVPREPDHSLR